MNKVEELIALKVLIVDQYKDDQILYERFLSEAGGFSYDITIANSGKEGVESYCEVLPDCVIVDYCLPDMDGLAFVESIQAITRHSAGILMITADGDEAVAVQALKSGVHDYLVKGKFTKYQLYSTVKNAVESAQMRVALQEKIKELEEKNRELAEKNEELEKFAYVASHDLKQPLRNLKLYLSTIHKRYAGVFDNEGEEYFAKMEDSLERMTELIEELLTYATIENMQKDFKKMNAEIPLGVAKMNLTQLIKEKNAEITNDPLPEITGSLPLLTQIFQNLLQNAITYCRETPKVHISATLEGDEYIFMVRDNGIGIPPEQTERIFGAFQRLHSYKEYPGNGLGLAACKKAVQLHGGRIWVESEPGKGSTFYFTLTAQPCPPQPEDQTS
jgi:signal transduction histidine kinase